MAFPNFKSLNDEILEIEREFDVLDSQNAIEAQIIECRIQRLYQIMKEMDETIESNSQPACGLRLVVSN